MIVQVTINWRFIVGIDISKLNLDIYLFDRQSGDGNSCQVPNTCEGFRQLAGWLKDHKASKSRTKCISEHTGRYGEQLLRWTTDNNWAHAVVKTTALEKVSWEHHRKTDEFDANQLAEYGDRFSDRLRLTEAPRPVVGQLKRLQAERRKMVDRRAALKNKLGEAEIHDADMEALTEMWNQQMEVLTEHIDQIEHRIHQLITTDPALSQRHQTMRSAPGMGPVLGVLWLSLFAGQKRLVARKISSRFGFAPHPHRSGSSVRGSERSTGFGNSEVRKVMHQAALSVKTHSPHYQNYYQEKRKEGKEHLLIINNIINKLIRLYCAMWNNRAEYDPNHIEKMNKKFKKSA